MTDIAFEENWVKGTWGVSVWFPATVWALQLCQDEKFKLRRVWLLKVSCRCKDTYIFFST